MIIDGTIVSQPYIGYRKTTDFVFDCIDWVDDIDTGKLDYRFLAIEENTGGVEVEIQPWSKSSTAHQIFDVRYYQAVSTNISIYCSVRDSMNATTNTSLKVVFYVKIR